MKTLEDKENLLLNRREIKVIVEAPKNPSFQEACKLISEKFKADEELIDIRNIGGKFGRDTFLISAYVYKNKKDKEEFAKKKPEAKEDSVVPAAQAAEEGK